MTTLKTKSASAKVSTIVEAACAKLIAHLSGMKDQERVTRGELHALIGSTRQAPVKRVVEVTDPETGKVTKREEDTGETQTIVDRFDLVDTLLEALGEANPDAFVMVPAGKLAGLYRGSVPAKTEKEEDTRTAEQKKADRAAAKVARAAEAKAQAYAEAMELLRKQGVEIPSNVKL